MKLDLKNEFAERAYQILTGLVAPRPIAMVTTLCADGSVSAAPISFFKLLDTGPATCAFAPCDRHDGALKDVEPNVRAIHEFVVDLMDDGDCRGGEPLRRPYRSVNARWPVQGCMPRPSSMVKPQRIAESPASLECRGATHCYRFRS